MTTVNRGAPVSMVTRNLPDGGTITSALHDGKDGHELLQRGEQCECGVLAIGTSSDANRTGNWWQHRKLTDDQVNGIAVWATWDLMPTADEARSLAFEVQASRDMLNAIDARHQPVEMEFGQLTCAGCDRGWPCPDHLTLHPDLNNQQEKQP
jgi:hypothetical protein